MPVTGIGGFFFRSKDPEGLAKWYLDHLGVGAPEGALTTPMSFMNTPRLNPVPTALEKASFAAKRLA